jgi:PPM family protein phosphatase
MIRACSFSTAGGHAVNEDAFDLHQTRNDPERWLVAIADGQGGRAGGAATSRLACSSVRAFALAESWVERLSQCDAAVAAMPSAGFTTLAGFEIHGDTLTGASCGDSAVLALYGSGEITELTKHQFKNPPVGSGEANFIPFEIALTRPWKVLALTDGVWKYAGWQKIRELASRFSGEELIAQLQIAARLKTSGEFPDDFTVVLLEGE